MLSGISIWQIESFFVWWMKRVWPATPRPRQGYNEGLKSRSVIFGPPKSRCSVVLNMLREFANAAKSLAIINTSVGPHLSQCFVFMGLFKWDFGIFFVAGLPFEIIPNRFVIWNLYFGSTVKCKNVSDVWIWCGNSHNVSLAPMPLWLGRKQKVLRLPSNQAMEGKKEICVLFFYMHALWNACCTRSWVFLPHLGFYHGFSFLPERVFPLFSPLEGSRLKSPDSARCLLLRLCGKDCRRASGAVDPPSPRRPDSVGPSAPTPAVITPPGQGALCLWPARISYPPPLGGWSYAGKLESLVLLATFARLVILEVAPF